MSMDDIKYGIKVELFNLGFVERNNNPFVFFFVLSSLCLELSMQKLYYWKTDEIFEYIFDFYLWFYIKFIVLYITSDRFKFSHKRCLEGISSECIWD